jgi:hypothetical protein
VPRKKSATLLSLSLYVAWCFSLAVFNNLYTQCFNCHMTWSSSVLILSIWCSIWSSYTWMTFSFSRLWKFSSTLLNVFSAFSFHFFFFCADDSWVFGILMVSQRFCMFGFYFLNFFLYCLNILIQDFCLSVFLAVLGFELSALCFFWLLLF